jgi:hypothetical protein
MIIKTINADLLTAKEQFICQQCNCVTRKAHGLSKYISTMYPWANPYAIRPEKTPNCTSLPDIPGTIVELNQDVAALSTHPDESIVNTHERMGNSSLTFLNFMAQWCPGKPKTFSKFYPQDYSDTVQNRKQWFQDCLDILDETDEYDEVAMPYGIGCGLAGGDWNDYEKMLNECSTRVILYRI